MGIEFFDPENVYAIFSNHNYETKRHAHYLLEIVCARQGTFSVATDRQNYDGLSTVIIPPNLPHRFNCLNAACDLLFLDPLSPIGSYFMHKYQLPVAGDILVDVPPTELFYEGGSFTLENSLLDAGPIWVPDERILRCLQAVANNFTEQNLSLSFLSAASFLSPGRLAHLFKQQLGVSVHQYILWKKVIFAITQSRNGSSLTECAHAAGFVDSAHFSKAFVRMFGIKPFFVLKT